MLRTVHAYAFGLLGLCAAMISAGASAGTIQIGFTGLNLSYDGSTLTDSGAPADPLSSVSVDFDGAPAAGSPFGAGSSIDLSVPGVTGIPTTGGTVLSGLGGTLDLDIAGGFGLDLDVNEVTVTYLDLTTVRFVFAGSTASVSSQSLPDGLLFTDADVTLSLNATVTSSTSSGGIVTGFEAVGAGNIEGAGIPEPTTVAMGLIALAGVAMRRR